MPLLFQINLAANVFLELYFIADLFGTIKPLPLIAINKAFAYFVHLRMRGITGYAFQSTSVNVKIKDFLYGIEIYFIWNFSLFSRLVKYYIVFLRSYLTDTGEKGRKSNLLKIPDLAQSWTKFQKYCLSVKKCYHILKKCLGRSPDIQLLFSPESFKFQIFYLTF